MLYKNESGKNEAVTVRIAKAIREGNRFFFHDCSGFDFPTNFALVYSAYVASLNGIDNADDLTSHIESTNSERRAIFVTSVAGDKLVIAFHLTREFSADDLRDYLRVCPGGGTRYGSELFETPESVSKLALRILDVKAGESVADFGSGPGSFLTLTAERYKYNPLFGIDINTVACEISTIRAELFSDKTTIELGDMFALSKEKKFDKIFSNYPFRTTRDLTRKRMEYLEVLRERSPEIRIGRLSNWAFNCLLLDHLTDNGKAVTVMNNLDVWYDYDREIRKYFINNGFIEAVIALPPRLFEYACIPTTMIVFSRENESVKMIDARELYERDKIGRRINLLSDSCIDRIVKLLTEGGEHATTVDLKKLRDNDFVIYPPRYLNVVEIEDGVEFGSLMKRVTRGTSLMGDDLVALTSDVPTNTRYLNVTNIQNGMISDDLPYLKELDPKLDKYCVGNRNLILSKIGSPFKVAVAEVEDGKKILVSGNLFIVELDEEKVNPYFLKAFFDSEMGMIALKSIVFDGVLPSISVDSLKKLTVSLPPMEKQNEIAGLYQAKQDEIKILQLKLQKAQNELREIFGEVE